MVIGRKQRKPTMADMLSKMMSSRDLDLHVALPGKVVAFDLATQKADIQPGIKKVLTDSKGEPQVFDLPVLYNVPVIFPRSGEFFILFPIAVGDFVLLVFNERPIDQWMETADQDEVDTVAPGLREMHGFNGAVAYPGMYPSGKALSYGAPAAMNIGKDQGQLVMIEPSAGQVHVGVPEAAKEFVAMANLVLTELQDIKTDLDNVKSTYDGHLHVCPVPGANSLTNGPGPPPLGTPVTAITTPHTPASVASSNLKAED